MTEKEHIQRSLKEEEEKSRSFYCELQDLKNIVNKNQNITEAMKQSEDRFNNVSAENERLRKLYEDENRAATDMYHELQSIRVRFNESQNKYEQECQKNQKYIADYEHLNTRFQSLTTEAETLRSTLEDRERLHRIADKELEEIRKKQNHDYAIIDGLKH
eukprot:jgi/Orpsp1_1/1188520/evm.model.d7180000065436.1